MRSKAAKDTERLSLNTGTSISLSKKLHFSYFSLTFENSKLFKS